MSMHWASAVTAAATGVLAVGAVVTTFFAIKAFGKQSGQLELQRQQLDDQRAINTRQTEVLELQTKELRQSLQEREREAAERHRAQASRVFIWEEHLDNVPGSPVDVHTAEPQPTPGVATHVKNASDQPIYNIIFSWHRGTAPHGQHPRQKPLMPGDSDKDVEALPSGTNPDLFGAVLVFRDAAGTTWRRRPDGTLDQIPAGEEPPHSW